MKQNMEFARQRADAAFKKEEPVRNGVEARQAYETAGVAIREKSARLKSLREAKQKADGKELRGRAAYSLIATPAPLPRRACVRFGQRQSAPAHRNRDN